MAVERRVEHHPPCRPKSGARRVFEHGQGPLGRVQAKIHARHGDQGPGHFRRGIGKRHEEILIGIDDTLQDAGREIPLQQLEQIRQPVTGQERRIVKPAVEQAIAWHAVQGAQPLHHRLGIDVADTRQATVRDIRTEPKIDRGQTIPICRQQRGILRIGQKRHIIAHGRSFRANRNG